MKRIYLIIVAIIGFCSVINAQTYYRMTYGPGGVFGTKDWIGNLALLSSSFDGINFTTTSETRGFVTHEGLWCFRSNESSKKSVLELIESVKKMPAPSTAIEGHGYAEYFSVGLFGLGARNSIDIVAVGGQSHIYSKGDASGLEISSEVGKKIFLYDKVYFDQHNWTYLGSGKYDEPIINNPNNKNLRIGSNGGIALYGKSGVETAENPTMYLSSDLVSFSTGIRVIEDSVKIYMGASKDLNHGWLGTKNNTGLYIGTNDYSTLYISEDHNLYIGLNHNAVSQIRADLKSKYKLFVSKGIVSEDYVIAPQNSWSDFVFQKNYSLPTITEVASFIDKNNHLPDVPSAKQVAEEGYSQHDMNKILLQKIEELTLYTIQQQNAMEKQQEEIQALKAKLGELKR